VNDGGQAEKTGANKNNPGQFMKNAEKKAEKQRRTQGSIDKK
jgi:hypothetical protein